MIFYLFMFFSPIQAAKYLPQAYNTIADNFSETRNHAWKEFIPLFAHLPINAKVLDAGCGNGRLWEYLSEHHTIASYAGIDISENLLAHAFQKYGNEPKVSFSQKNFLEINEQNQYDCIASIASFHHLATQKERKAVLKNLYNALTENGTLVMTVWNWRNQKKYQQNAKEAMIRSMWNPLFGTHDGIISYGVEKIPRYYYGFSETEIKNLFAEAGFCEIETFFSEKDQNICIIGYKKITSFREYTLLDIPFHIVSFQNTLEILERWTKTSGLQKKIYTPNPEMIIESKKNEFFRSILQQADLSLPDGNGVIWASGIEAIRTKYGIWKWMLGIFSLFQYLFRRKYFSRMLEKPVCGSDIFREFLDKKIGKVFLLGGYADSAEYIQKQYPHIVGVENRKITNENIPEIIERINTSGANILFVALGAPKQEIFIHENIQNMPNLSFAMGVGGSFDFLAGYQKRSPEWIRKWGLEWLYRLMNDPKRIKRIWNATGGFIYTILSRDI